MDNRPPLPLADRSSADRLQRSLRTGIAAAQAWWKDAGVDHVYRDEPQGWLADREPAANEPPAAPESAAPPPRPGIGGDASAWPEDLAAFHRWWLEEPSLDSGGTHPRVAPRGAAEAALMMLVPMPEGDDRETLLSGPEGRLLASLAAAMELEPHKVYLAAALPRHTALPDWAALHEAGLGQVLLHHIGLVRPERLLVLGSSILPLLGHDPAQPAPGFTEISIQRRRVPVLATFAPARLLGNARQRASLWQRWLEWTERESS